MSSDNENLWTVLWSMLFLLIFLTTLSACTPADEYRQQQYEHASCTVETDVELRKELYTACVQGREPHRCVNEAKELSEIKTWN